MTAFTIVAANTGHMDIIADDCCLALTRQCRVDDPEHKRAGWGASDVEEMLAHLETVFADTRGANDMGARAAARMAKLDWSHQIGLFLDALEMKN